MAEDKSYNGWSNYETWAMALWIDNDQGSYNESREIVQLAADAQLAPWEDSSARTKVGLAAEALSDWQGCLLDDWSPDSASVFTDLLRAAFQEIDWYEIAQNYLSELAEA